MVERKEAPLEIISGQQIDSFPIKGAVLDSSLGIACEFPEKGIRRVIEYRTRRGEPKIRVELTDGGQATFRADKAFYNRDR